VLSQPSDYHRERCVQAAEGNAGLLVPGSVQWMPAGRSVIRSEIPEQQEGAMEGSQLWLNLPSCDKMQAPWYRDIAPEELPRWFSAGGAVTVIAGQAQESDEHTPGIRSGAAGLSSRQAGGGHRASRLNFGLRDRSAECGKRTADC